MCKGRVLARVSVLLAAALLSLRCSDAGGPERQVAPPLGAVAAAGDPIQLDQQNGVCGSGTFLIKGFNPTNPHVGDAILATVFWFGAPGGLTGNIIDSVTDVLTSTPFTPVGNKYELVDLLSDGTIWPAAPAVRGGVGGCPHPVRASGSPACSGSAQRRQRGSRP